MFIYIMNLLYWGQVRTGQNRKSVSLLFVKSRREEPEASNKISEIETRTHNNNSLFLKNKTVEAIGNVKDVYSLSFYNTFP